MMWTRLADGSAPDQVDDREQDDRADKRIEKRLDREPGIDAAAEQQAGNHRTNDSDDDVEDNALLSIRAHDETCKPAADTTDDQPDDNTHELSLLFSGS